MWGVSRTSKWSLVKLFKRTSLISCQSFKQADSSQKDRSVFPGFAGKQLFTKTKSKEIAARANNYLLMLILNVKEHPWKLPDGRIALGFTPLAMKTLCSSWMMKMLVAVIGIAITSVGVLGTALVDPEVEEDDAACSGSVFSFPCINEVSAKDMCWNWRRVGLSQ